MTLKLYFAPGACSFVPHALLETAGELEGLADQATAQGRPCLGGERFGPLDAYALTLLRWGGFAGHDPQRRPALWALVRRVAQLPAVARAIERERLQLNVYKAA